MMGEQFQRAIGKRDGVNEAQGGLDGAGQSECRSWSDGWNDAGLVQVG